MQYERIPKNPGSDKEFAKSHDFTAQGKAFEAAVGLRPPTSIETFDRPASAKVIELAASQPPSEKPKV